MKEGLLLGRVASKRCDVVCWDSEMTTFVEPDLADAALPLFDQAAVSTGKTFKGVVLEMLRQFSRAFSGHRIEDIGER